MDADSTKGLLHEVGWCLAALVLFTGFFHWDRFAVAPTPTRVAGSMLIGSAIGTIGPILSHTERARALYEERVYRFIMIFVPAVGIQVSLIVVPTWTILTTLMTFLVAIPTRLAIYVRARA